MADAEPAPAPEKVATDATADMSKGFVPPPPPDLGQTKVGPAPGVKPKIVIPPEIVAGILDSPNQLAFAFTRDPVWPFTQVESEAIGSYGSQVLSRYLPDIKYLDLIIFVGYYTAIESRKAATYSLHRPKEPKRAPAPATPVAPAPAPASPPDAQANRGLPPAVAAALGG